MRLSNFQGDTNTAGVQISLWFGHTLQLAIDDSLKMSPGIQNILKSAKAITIIQATERLKDRAEVIMLIIILFRISCNSTALCSKFHALFSRLFSKSFIKTV